MQTEHPPETDDAADANTISIAAAAEVPGVRIVDLVDNHQFTIETPAPVRTDRVSPDRLPAPVDETRIVETESISYDSVCAIFVRDTDQTPLAELDRFADAGFEPGHYVLELATPVKVYLGVDAGFRVTTTGDRTEIDFGDPTEVVVGARSRHQHPAGTVTTPADPTAMMEAVATLSSALKTTSPERAYPTLRGHPPLLELGDALEIPEGLERPDSGITLELPATHEAVFPAAPLAYYLGADVVPAGRPRLVTDEGFTYDLDRPDGYEETVARLLKRLFFLDCVTRTEGFYQVDLQERRAIESQVDLNFQALYDAPLARQVEAYLDVPYDRIRDAIPEWKLITQVMPTPDTVEFLPFLVNELSVVKTQPSPTPTTSVQEVTAINEFTRNDFTRSTSPDQGASVPSVIETDIDEGLSRAWIGEGAPAGASKPSLAAYHNKLQREPTADDISIAVVSNDEAMADEQTDVERVYGSRDNLPFEVSLFENMTVERLRLLLGADLDFLHYIGHVEADGILCADGKLDVAELDSVGIDSFLLNACRSYDQGTKLIERGAIGGVVTLREIINSGAVEIGQTIARLLNRGFPLQAALDLAKDESVVGQQYIVVGDGEVSIAQSEAGAPNFCRIHRTDDGFRVTYETYPTTTKGMGSLILPYVDTTDRHYLNSGVIDIFEVDEADLERFLSLENIPVFVGEDLRWSNSLDISEL